MSPGTVKMDEFKPLISSGNLRSDGGSSIETRFGDLCKVLSLDEEMIKQATALFRESKRLILMNTAVIGSGSPEESERLWSAFVLYAVKRLSDKNCNFRFDLCQVLRVLKLNLVNFLKEIPQFSIKASRIVSNFYGTDWEKRLGVKELQENFEHLTILSKYYKRTYQKFFLSSEVNDDKHSTVGSSKGCVSDYHHFGWLLFLTLRIHTFSSFKDLVTCTNGLVSIMAILILHVPAHLRNFSLHDSALFVRKCNEGVDLLASLSKIYQTSEDDLRRAIEKVNNLLVDILKKKPQMASECKTENLDNINTDGLTYFDDLMEEESLSSNLLILDKNYADALYNKGEMDERVFINEEENLLGTASGIATNLCVTKRKFDTMASPTKTIGGPPYSYSSSPVNGSIVGTNSNMPPTPVSTAMTTAKWLRTVISPLLSKPSAELGHFFSSCDRDVTNDIKRRAKIILEAIFPSANSLDSIWAEQRKIEALKLYYRVLEAICKTEARVLHDNNLTSLLINERFHRCMLACSAELVLATHKTVTMLFPAVLERTGLTAFDLSKVIESFVRHEETLPRELKRHLNSLEEQLLESMAWEKGSSMYNSLIVAKPALSDEINRLGLLAEPMPSLDAITIHYNISSGGLPPLPSLQKHETALDQNGDVRSPKRACGYYRSALVERNSFTTPVKDRLLTFNSLKSRLPTLQSSFGSPTTPNIAGEGETCAETGINVFFSKIKILAAARIQSLSERLQLSQQVVESVYSLVEEILSQRTTLFFNRHIDQLILCSFYGFAKISHVNLTFKEIIENYRKQPQCKSQVFRSVFVDRTATSRSGRTGQDHVDIITFYNDIFVPAVKPLLDLLGPAGATHKTNALPEDNNKADGHCPGSPRLSTFPRLPDMSPKKVSATHNVYVAPLRSSKMDVLISPSSKSYYACVGESTHAYQSPSKDLTAINNRLNGIRKINGRLNFDEVGLISDSLVAGSLYPQQNGSCASSSGAGATLNSPLKTEPTDT